MKLDIGIASYGRNTENLIRTMRSIQENTVSEWRCFLIHNPSDGDDATREVIRQAPVPFVPVWMDKNEGYAGAVNRLMDEADSDYIAYCDNDIEIQTHGWDQRFIDLLAFPEVGQAFPGSGHYGFHNGRYDECLWNAGYCWMTKRTALEKLRTSDALHNRCTEGFPMTTSLGHHEEVDLMIRLRLAGFQIACDPEVKVLHHETATRSDDALHKPGGRIHDGVVRWMNRHNGYFCGDQLQYSMTKYDDRMLRYTDWPPCALYLERMTLAKFPSWNSNPRSVHVPGVGNMDVIEVLKPTGCYKGRAI